MAAGLVEMKANKTLYCWFCEGLGHPKNDYPLKQKKALTVTKPKWRTIVSIKDSVKEVIKHLLKQFKCFHCEKLNHIEDDFFILHLEKRLSSTRKKALEAKISALGEKFKNLGYLAKCWIHTLHPEHKLAHPL